MLWLTELIFLAELIYPGDWFNLLSLGFKWFSTSICISSKAEDWSSLCEYESILSSERSLSGDTYCWMTSLTNLCSTASFMMLDGDSFELNNPAVCLWKNSLSDFRATVLLCTRMSYSLRRYLKPTTSSFNTFLWTLSFFTSYTSSSIFFI